MDRERSNPNELNTPKVYPALVAGVVILFGFWVIVFLANGLIDSLCKGVR